MTRWTTRIAVALGAVLWIATASAAYENFTLAPGFTPDPASGSGQSGGPIDGSKHGSTEHGPCVGQIDDSPDHRMELTSAFSYLRVHAISDQDVSLVIKGPDGYRCNDDSDGLNPVIEGSWPAGTYEIHIGSVASGNHAYTLAVSELRP